MSAYPIQHVRTRRETIDEMKAFVARELGELERAIEFSIGRVSRVSIIELVAEKNAYARMMKFLLNLG